MGYAWGGNQASCTGEVYTIPTAVKQIPGYTDIKYNNELSNKVYCVESPNSIFASDKLGMPFMRYTENNRNAGIVSRREGYRTAVLGFPFETIVSREVRDLLMKQILDFFVSEN